MSNLVCSNETLLTFKSEFQLALNNQIWGTMVEVEYAFTLTKGSKCLWYDLTNDCNNSLRYHIESIYNTMVLDMIISHK